MFDNTLNFTPIVFVDMKTTVFNTQAYSGLTVGGTIGYYYNPEYSSYGEDKFLKYEIGHIYGYDSFGVNYFIKVFEEPCKYDPKSTWGYSVCVAPYNRTIDPTQLSKNTGTFTIKF